MERYQRRGGERRGRGEIIPTGVGGIDAILPHGGLPVGSVVEVLSGGSGIGARTLAFRVAIGVAGRHAKRGEWLGERRVPGESAKLLTPSKWVVVVDCEGDFYPPAAVAMGVPVGRLVVVRVRKRADAFWATDQALRCEAVGAVITTRLVLDAAGSRRLQLAAEGSGGLGLILGPVPTVRGMGHPAGGPTFAAVRMLIEPVSMGPNPCPPPATPGWGTRSEGMGHVGCAAARRFRVTLLKVREGKPVEPVIVGVSDESFDVPLCSVPADRAAEDRRRRRSA